MYFLYGAILFSMQCRSQCLTPMARPDTDIENAAYYIDYVKVIEGIVNDREISFYYYNSENDKLIRVPLFVDNIEKLPLREQSMTKIIKNSFLEGMARAKRR